MLVATRIGCPLSLRSDRRTSAALSNQRRTPKGSFREGTTQAAVAGAAVVTRGIGGTALAGPWTEQGVAGPGADRADPKARAASARGTRTPQSFARCSASCCCRTDALAVHGRRSRARESRQRIPRLGAREFAELDGRYFEMKIDALEQRPGNALLVEFDLLRAAATLALRIAEIAAGTRIEAGPTRT